MFLLFTDYFYFIIRIEKNKKLFHCENKYVMII